METSRYRTPTNVVKIPKGDRGYSTVKKNYRRFLWTWNNPPENRDDDYQEDAVVEAEVIRTLMRDADSTQDVMSGYRRRLADLLEKAQMDEFQVRLIGGEPVYYQKEGDRWKFISKDEFDRALSVGYVEESGELYLGPVWGMGDSDKLPGGNTGYRSGPLSQDRMMRTSDHMDPDERMRMSGKSMKHLVYLDEWDD